MLSNSSEEEYESSTLEEQWADVFIRKLAAPVLVRVPQEYIEDAFNLYGLSDLVKDFPRALEALKNSYVAALSKKEETLYLLVHQRFIVTRCGMELMHALVCRGSYGKCRRVACKGFPLLPAGLSDFPGYANTKLFCHQCADIYEPAEELAKIDGCAFGRTFPHFFVLMYKELFAKSTPGPKYTPRIFGFAVDTEQEQ